MTCYPQMTRMVGREQIQSPKNQSFDSFGSVLHFFVVVVDESPAGQMGSLCMRSDLRSSACSLAPSLPSSSLSPTWAARKR